MRKRNVPTHSQLFLYLRIWKCRIRFFLAFHTFIEKLKRHKLLFCVAGIFEIPEISFRMRINYNPWIVGFLKEVNQKSVLLTWLVFSYWWFLVHVMVKFSTNVELQTPTNFLRVRLSEFEDTVVWGEEDINFKIVAHF